MKRLLPVFIILVVVVVLVGLAARAQAEGTPRLRRYALVIGANDGGSDRVMLRYATTDAEAVARVMRELGGVQEHDVVLLRDPSRADIDEGFEQMRDKIANAEGRVRTELLVYYSGHSDEEGLLLGGARLPYADLRERIRGMPSDVNIAILDSCASGAFTRRKGGKLVAPFLVDESSRVRGYAFLTSSSADEAAQESDRLAASFFTHYLVSGMRGGADANHDGRITLNEAYQFAFGETVTRTQTTQAGPQHPAYAIDLVGTGDVVMTDLRATSAALVVAEDVAGRLFIEDESGHLVIELQKPAGRPVVLGLGPERYDVTLRTDSASYRARVQLVRGQRTRIAAADFHGVASEQTVARGGAPTDSGSADVYRVPVALQFLPMIAIGAHRDRPVVNNLAINVLVGRGDHLEGFELGGFVNLRDGNVRGAQLAGFVNLVGGNYRGAQVAGFVNAVGGDFEGVQLSGTANWASGRVHGAQLSLLNVGGSVRGAQIGLVNIARRSRGLQLGLVNVADDSDGVPVGLVNVVRNGYHALELWTSDTAPFNVGVKLGSRRFYTMFAAAADDERLMAGWGLGVHTVSGDAYVDVDLVGYGIVDHDFDDTEDDLLAKLRVSVGFRVNRQLAVFGGATASGTFAFYDKEGKGVSLIDGKRIDADDFVVRVAPGLFAGVQF